MPPTFSSFTQVFSSDFLPNLIYFNMLEMATSKDQRLNHLNHNNSKHDLRHYLNNNKDKASDKKYATKTEESYYKREENRQSISFLTLEPIKRDDRGKDSPSNWSEHMSRTGRIYYYNSQTEVSQWEKPNILVERESYSRMKANRLSAKRILEHEYVATDNRISDKHEGNNQKGSCNTLYGAPPNHHSRTECNKQQTSTHSKLNFEHSRPMNDHLKTSNSKYYTRNDAKDSTTTLNNNKRKEFDTKDSVPSFIKHGSGDRVRSETLKIVSSREDIDDKRRNKRLNTLDVVSKEVNSNAYDSNDVADDGSSISMDIEKEDSESPKLNLQKALTNLHNAIMLSHSKNSPQNETKPRKSSQYQSVSKNDEMPLNSSHVRRHTLDHHVKVKHNGHTKKVTDYDLLPTQSPPLFYHCEETDKKHKVKDKVVAAAVFTEEKSSYKDGDLIPPPLAHHKTADELEDHDDDHDECNDGTTSSLLSFQASSPTSISSVSSSPASLHDDAHEHHLPDEDTTKIKDLLSNKSPHRSRAATKKIQKINKLESQHDISLMEEDIESISSPDDVFIASSLSSPLPTGPTIESNDLPEKLIGDKKNLKHETTITAIKSEIKDDGENLASKTIIITKTQNGLPLSNLVNEYETNVENYESIDKTIYLPNKQNTAFSQCFLKKSYLAQISSKPLATINQIESKYKWSILTNEKDFMGAYSNLCYKSASINASTDTDIQDKLSFSTKIINEEKSSDIQPSTIDIEYHDLGGALRYLYAHECHTTTTDDDFQKEFKIQTELLDYIYADGIKNEINYQTLPQTKCNIPPIENNTEIDLKNWDANDLEIKSNAIFGETGFIHAKSLCNYGTDILSLLADTQLLDIKKDLKTHKLNGLDSVSKTIQEMKIEKSK